MRIVRRAARAVVVVGVLAATVTAVAVAGPSPAGAATARPARLTVGAGHACALTPQGGVRCWGGNESGQLGIGTTVASPLPVDVIGLTSGVIAVEAGDRHTCALTTAGAMRCWGNNVVGQLGDGTTVSASLPVDVVGMGSGVAAMAAGRGHTCALTTSGGTWCWGTDADGQLGNGADGASPIPIPVPGLEAGTRAIAVGTNHSCAITAPGGATCWGESNWGEIGDQKLGTHPDPTPVPGYGTGVTAIAAGGSHTCIIVTDATVVCWGLGGWGQVGVGAVSINGPRPIEGVEDVTALALGARHSCALATEEVVCWGDNELAQSGLDKLRRGSPPTVVPGSAGTFTIAATADTTCGLRIGGSVQCWGRNEVGQLGNGRTETVTVPQPVALPTDPLRSLSTRGRHVCARSEAGAVWCWGDNQYGALGLGVEGQSVLSATAAPTPVPSRSAGVAMVAAGVNHTCSLDTQGAVSCWGATLYGQVGDGTASSTTARLSPVQVSGLTSGTTMIAAGDDHTCARSTAGGVVCWGRGGDGQLGNGTTTASSVPVAVTGLGSGVATVAGGARHTCAISTTGALACWGRNEFGQLGNGTTTSSSVPVAVSGLTSGVTAVALGASHTCAMVNGDVHCWGLGANGRLGLGDTSGSMIPLPVVGLPSPVTAISAGADHSCAIADGGAWCWGANAVGQLGDGTTTERVAAVAVSGLSDQTTIVAGSTMTCATGGADAVHCWGQDADARLGFGTVQQVDGGSTAFSTGPLVAWHPFGSWSELVTQLFLDITAAPPSASALAEWVTALSTGTKTEGDLAATLRTSSDNLTNVDATARLYRAFLGRAPDPDGLLFWIRRRRTGTWKLVRMADQFAASSEFKRRYGTLSNRAFVTLIYTDVMGRPADPGGVAYWTGQLDSKRRTRGGVMVGFSESSEYQRKQAVNTAVAVGYIFLLGRAASAGETADWRALDAAGATSAALLLDLIDSPAFAARFGG